MRRSEIWWANLAPRSGSEQSRTRPVIIVSHDGLNMTPGWRSITVIPMTTSSRQARRGPTVAILPAGAGGLQTSGVAVCHQVTTVDRSKLQKRIGQLDASLMEEVEAALRATLGLA